VELARTNRVVTADVPCPEGSAETAAEGSAETAAEGSAETAAEGSAETAAASLDEGHAWLAELVAQSCPSPPVLVGFGAGGAAATGFARTCTHAELRQLVLVDTLGPAPFPPSADFWLAVYEFLGSAGRRSGLPQDAVALAALRRRLDTQWAAFQATAIDKAQSESLLGALRVLMDKLGGPPVPPDDLAAIGVPTSLIWGSLDRTTPLTVAEAVSGRHGWPLHVIDNCGEDPAVEAPETFVRILRAVLPTTAEPD
jgi:pimeloyl-ACP methyl ester carboxylesterase